MKKEKVYLADLTHTGQVVASNIAPLGIGLIASYAKIQKPDLADFSLYKYPEDFNQALETEIPKVVGFANYSWNCELAYKFTEKIKAKSPSTVVVFGGPNYGLETEEIETFWENYPLIDFYVVKEGEVAFLQLLEKLIDNDFNVEKVKRAAEPPLNCTFRLDGKLVNTDLLPRINNLDELGSPYLSGLMDKFFDGVLIPMIHTTRGCPFTCAFCTEGAKYYSKVTQRIDLREELEYIAERRKTIQDLTITDANFGMWSQDIDKATILAEIQKKYEWPKRILVSTGKNQKERVVEVAGMLNGAVQVAASLQSTNEEILKNIKRSNISQDALTQMVEQSGQAESSTYTELILCLPGDTFETHIQSLRDVVNSGIGIVRMYQLILLPQTELNTPDTRRKYGMKTKFRINPRSFGIYRMLGESVPAIESEEICIQNDTMSFETYLECREMDLTIEMLHNTGLFQELQGLVKHYNLSWFDFLYSFYEGRRNFSGELTQLFNNFTSDTKSRLWDSKEDLMHHVEENMESYLNDPYGTNEMATSKALAFFRISSELHDILFNLMREILIKRDLLNEVNDLYLEQLKKFSFLRKNELLDTSLTLSEDFDFDFDLIRKKNYQIEPADYKLTDKKTFNFFHSVDQIPLIDGYITQYGKSIDGLGRILMRAPVKSFFRDIQTVATKSSGLTMESFG
ncbi:MAG: cobalamin-dependent protein [Leptospira sp.]|nr:cobalamin-dependent protein [Leptospira sp.]